MAVPATRLLTFEDLFDTPDDRQRYEIIGGKLVVTPVPIPVHQQVCSRMGNRFFAYVDANNLGLVYTSPPDVRLSPHNVVVPDLIYVSHARRGIVRPNLIDGAPDLVVEVLSPSTRKRDLTDKATLYAASGVREYWLVDPRHRGVTVRAFEANTEMTARETGVVCSTILPAFELDVAELFANLW